ncbi:hypothetical protein D8674_026502 [Pyrus ussuriensis x Pyrus communis]|uniref:Uncharacterized protein n=1 Tax=Pyrus ussuriensis x Pyrus communis TaxID=2448454 RepID=A0A5N5I840_9ROSA|nr:hypothetical protein D8674_026502 [Pyrus ussuriensis x Pyrus communis]
MLSLEDVANIMHFLTAGNVDPFCYIIPSADTNIFYVWKKDASTSLSKAFCFNERIKHFWQNKQESNCRFKVMLCLWLGRFIFCDSKDTFNHQVTGSALLKSFVCVSFFQIFLWEHIKSLKITPCPSGSAKSHYVINSTFYLPEKLQLACRWFGKIPCFTCCASDDAVKHFRPRMVKDNPPSCKPDDSITPKKLKSESSLGKPKLVVLVGLARRAWSARAFAFSGTPKSHKFLDITEASEEKLSVGETEGDEVAKKGLAAEESSNRSTEYDLRSGEHPHASLRNDEKNGRPSSKDGSKVVKDVDLNEVDEFLNDDILVEVENIKVCLPILR